VDDDKQSKNPKAPLNTVSTILEILKEDGMLSFFVEYLMNIVFAYLLL